MFSRMISSGNGVAAFQQCKENVSKRETLSTKFFSKFEKSGKLEDVGKFIIKVIFT